MRLKSSRDTETQKKLNMLFKFQIYCGKSKEDLEEHLMKRLLKNTHYIMPFDNVVWRWLLKIIYSKFKRYILSMTKKTTLT